MTDLQKAQVAALVRVVLILCGGWLAKKGVSVDVMTWTDDILAAIGGAQVLFALLWSFKEKKAAAPALAVAKQVQEGKAEISNTAFATLADVKKTEAHVEEIVAAKPEVKP